MIYCKDNKELHLSGTADLLLAQATAIAINVLKVACAGRKDEMRKEIVEKFVELVVKDVCGEKSKVSDGNCLIKVENGITTMAGNAKDILEALEICVSVVVKTLAGEDEDKAGSLVCEFISHTTERMIRTTEEGALQDAQLSDLVSCLYTALDSAVVARDEYQSRAEAEIPEELDYCEAV